MVGVQTHEVRVELKGMEPAAVVERMSECCGMAGRWPPEQIPVMTLRGRGPE